MRGGRDSNLQPNDETAEKMPVRGAGPLETDPESEAKCPNAGAVTIATVTIVDPVEAALATALEGATAAGEWSTVAQLARELEARRKSRSGVIQLDDVRAQKGGTK